MEPKQRQVFPHPADKSEGPQSQSSRDDRASRRHVRNRAAAAAITDPSAKNDVRHIDIEGKTRDNSTIKDVRHVGDIGPASGDALARLKAGKPGSYERN